MCVEVVSEDHGLDREERGPCEDDHDTHELDE